ncbi:HNH endonuclease [Phycicoccus sp. BSK3Z-2]|uniref:HNH endonuclease n=1 Tax=Phycicoccus avicenniae TaxID=2828860 RepID=A0A941I0M8_9MICO|nr:HNH endonuclease family protein [Phycicoccus avicenniae]MBR7744080.1 HNH endonuclease [Phycicoccus avicenniae]
MRSTIAFAASALVAAAVGLALPSSAQAAYQTTPARILNALDVRAESNSGYDRAKFPHWLDVDKDCQDTREEVLVAESRVRIGGCSFSTGRWYSMYDGRWYTRKAQVDIDHHVALAEAWGSGARSWSKDRRTRFANDLYAPSLNVMTPSLNRYQKNAYDPGQWMPPKNRCRYAVDWVKVKYRWRLSIDSREKAALQRILSGTCGSRTVVLPRRA